MINNYLLELPETACNTLYSVFGYFQWPVYFGMFLWYSTKFSLSVRQKVLLFVVFTISLFWGNSLCPLLHKVTGGIFPRANMGISFLFFLLIASSAVYMLRIPVLCSLDAIVPLFLLGRGVAIIGCIFTGCCYGYPSSWGLYSHRAETVVFPTVVLDSIISYLIVAFLLILARKQRYSGNGLVFATGLFLFGILRIIIDVLRDNWKLISVFTVEGFAGMTYALAGTILILWLLHKDKQIDMAAMK